MAGGGHESRVHQDFKRSEMLRAGNGFSCGTSDGQEVGDHALGTFVLAAQGGYGARVAIDDHAMSVEPTADINR